MATFTLLWQPGRDSTGFGRQSLPVEGFVQKNSAGDSPVMLAIPLWAYELVAFSPLVDHHSGRAVVELVAQLVGIPSDDGGIDSSCLPPDPLLQGLVVDEPPLVAHQVVQKLVFSSCKVNRLSTQYNLF